MVEINIPDNWISNTLKVGGVLIVLVMIATLIRPSITGNVVNKVSELNENLSVCTTELAKANAELSANDGLIANMQLDVGNMTAELNAANKENEALQNENTNLTDELDLVETAYDSLERTHARTLIELNVSSTDFKKMADFAASVFCCQQRFVDGDIDSYNIVNNKIKCAADGDGEYSLECS